MILLLPSRYAGQLQCLPLLDPDHVACSQQHQRDGHHNEEPELPCKDEMRITIWCIRLLRLYQARAENCLCQHFSVSNLPYILYVDPLGKARLRTAMNVGGRYRVPSTARAFNAPPSFLLCSASLTNLSFSRLE